ncbi:phage portal protein [archaeon]|nr:phage portal protein [archaeon]
MISLKDRIFGKKSVAMVGLLEEQTREGLNKSYIPKFLYKPPFGYPRASNIPFIRYLATTPYVDMCITTIIGEICSIEWDIVPTDGMEDQADDNEIEHIRTFFKNPNTNDESFDEVFIKMPVRDLLEINTGLLNKIFNRREDLVEVVARDGGTFTKNPDFHGMYTNRQEIMLPTEIIDSEHTVINPFKQITIPSVREQAAYFQYGWIAGPMPVPFGKREIVWMEQNKRTDDHYGYSAVQILAKNLQMLIYMLESDLDYYNDNNVPKGIIGLEDMDSDALKAFKTQWTEMQQKKDDFGNYKKMIHKVPILNTTATFTRIAFSSQEMEVIEKQRWYTKMVWASFGVTATELGYTEDSKGSANQIVQSKVFRKKAINPMLRILENKYNQNIVSEFGYVGKVKTKNGSILTKPKYKLVFKRFDTDEERQKYELYELQTKTGIRTINEVRKDEGLEDVEWGDKPPREWQQAENNTFINGGPEDNFSKRERDAQDTNIPGKEPKVENPENQKKKESKASDMNSPLVLREGETPTNSKILERAIVYILNQNKKEINKLIESEVKTSQLSEIKDLNSIIEKIKDFFNIAALKTITDALIRNNYMDGWDDAEEQMNKNYLPEEHAIDYLQDYTFDNIKGMTDDIENKLRQELQRGYMEGEGVTKLKSRITKVFDVGKNRSEMIARTETTRASNFGRLQAYQKAGEKGKKQWVTHKDDRTSDICNRLDGQIVDINADFVDSKTGWTGLAPPSHVNCRSKFIFIPKDD